MFGVAGDGELFVGGDDENGDFGSFGGNPSRGGDEAVVDEVLVGVDGDTEGLFEAI